MTLKLVLPDERRGRRNPSEPANDFLFAGAEVTAIEDRILRRLLTFPAADESELAPAPRPELLRFACALRSSYAARTGPFPCELFGEPAWDLVLLAYCSPRDGTNLSAAKLIEDSGGFRQIALRWMVRLFEDGILVRTNDDWNSDSLSVALSRCAQDKLESWLRRMIECLAPLQAER